MDQLKGVYTTKKKNGTIYYRSSITYKNKHISLGSYNSKLIAHQVYLDANAILFKNKYTYNNYPNHIVLPFDKWIILHNYKDNGIYIKNPIYLHKYYFSYFIDENCELFFDVDDLFYYSTHKIFKRNGYLFVNDYGIQSNIMSRFGIKNFAVEGKDYYFKDNNLYNLRYHNVVVVNRYYGVTKIINNSEEIFVAKIHINGDYIIGKYNSEIKAAIAYNKAADYVNNNKISMKNFVRNYIENLDSSNYLEIYRKIKISKRIINLKKQFF